MSNVACVLPQTFHVACDVFSLSMNHALCVAPSMVCGGWSGAPRLFPASLREHFQPPPKSIPRSIGHRPEWIRACKEKKPADAKAGFAYSGPFTEALLVGNLALRLQKRIEWDATQMKATNASEADALIRKRYRDGFGIGV